MASAERWISGRNSWSGMRARDSQWRQKRVVASSRALASSTRGRNRRVVVPRQRAEQLLSLVEHVPGADVIGLDPEQHVGLQPHRLAGPGGVGAVAVRRQRPVGEHAAVVEPRLAHQLDLDAALDALDRPDEHVVGVLVGRRAGMRGDRVLAAARSHRERVVDHRPPRRRLPDRDQGVGPGQVVAAARHVDPERGEPERAGPAVEQRAEHARRVEPRDAEPVDRAVGRDQRAGVAVRQEGVVGDRSERRGRGGALRHRRHRAGRRGRGRGSGMAVALRALLGLGCAHDATHGCASARNPRPPAPPRGDPTIPWRTGAPAGDARATAPSPASTPRRRPDG